ncbi:kinase-like domain-containing protein [Elsinoe ampelina]|uniref:Kinase-like domain-containing protein n=1 Tax=Elsinoe ampelina TaxID=302913 RepID=A0A6A6GNX5_9PEZI|nr:kinase-like domain-containing protein [Elsinoe ampelina]
MIEPGDRFFCNGGMQGEFDGYDSYRFTVTDWDQRGQYLAFGRRPSGELYGDDEEAVHDKIAEGVGRAITKLEPDDWIVHLDRDFELDSSACSPPEDTRLAPFYHKLADCPSLVGLPTIKRNQLIEVDRTSPLVDICYYRTEQSAKKYCSFKYYCMFSNQMMIWQELHLWKSLPRHPHIASFDRVVIDETDARVLGFTAEYVPGGSIECNPPRIFKFKWLEQLITVVDDLNLQYGILHRDVHPRNILIDEKSDSVKLMDFNFSEWIGDYRAYATDRRDDAAGLAFTLYELITRDNSRRSEVFYYPDVESILKMKTWEIHRDVLLDRDVESFCQTLQNWLKARANRVVKHWSACPAHIPKPPSFSNPEKSQIDSADHGEEHPSKGLDLPVHDEANGSKYQVKWDRPEAAKRIKGVEYLASGDPLDGTLEAIL